MNALAVIQVLLLPVSACLVDLTGHTSHKAGWAVLAMSSARSVSLPVLTLTSAIAPTSLKGGHLMMILALSMMILSNVSTLRRHSYGGKSY